MDCFWAEIVSDDLILKEHEAAKWLTMESFRFCGLAAGGCETDRNDKNMLRLKQPP